MTLLLRSCQRCLTHGRLSHTYLYHSNSPSLTPSHIINNRRREKNKGDLIVVPSTTSWHLLQLMDVNTALNPLLKRRRKDSYKAMKGHVGGDTADAAVAAVAAAGYTYTYSIDTMGCQMNSADSERMEAQVYPPTHVPLSPTLTHPLTPILTYVSLTPTHTPPSWWS